jgi:hypothetical protein
MGVIVIAAYRPREGGDARLRELIRGHVPALRAEGLITDRPVTLMRSKEDGTYLEVFEWVDEDGSRKAHESPVVGAIWGAMMEVATFPSLGELAEAGGRFPHFEPVDDWTHERGE